MAATVFLPVYKHGAKVLKIRRAPPIFRKYFLEIPKNQQLTVLDRNECQSQEEHRSDIVWTNSEVTGIRQTACDQSRFNGKYLDHGRLVIIRNGEKYSMDGLRRK